MCGLLVYTGLEYKKYSDKLKSGFDSLVHRGPDDSSILNYSKGSMFFHRLSINDLGLNANQPFVRGDYHLVCNGEIYNHHALKNEFSLELPSNSDCEVIIPLFKKFGIEGLLNKIDGEFAFVLYDNVKKQHFVARDPIGIRPLFYAKLSNNEFVFASEAKALIELSNEVHPFPPGYYWDGKDFIQYLDITKVDKYHNDSMETIADNIHDLLVQGIVTRLDADANIGFLLSGGLDSSIVCAIAQKNSKKPIDTFAIGMESDPIDLKYAQIVANHIGSNHHEIIISEQDVLDACKEVIYHLESYDITTIRASIGMHLICKYIKENTNIKSVMTGELSDELFGYKYTDFAPNAHEFQLEAKKRIDEIYLYDVLRADRTISANSLEARVPFSDQKFVEYVMAINPEVKLNKYNMGKFLLRNAFNRNDYLPESILYRDKAAFSDAVGHSLVDCLKDYANQNYKHSDLSRAKLKYPHVTPFTNESLMYRDIFESFYKGKSYWVKDFWMPNKTWENCNVSDPSARVLPNYGESGK
ncbi:MAG: asparagine synthetase B [Candidatus Cloacimonadota bacterium]|nr:MAG: asparagine synthetase B [Candidatus Cloacimonadota bacterium]